MALGQPRICLHCGASVSGELCPQCGLSASAASLLLRRWTVLRTGVFLLGTLAFLAAAYRFPPLELDGMLIFIGALFVVGLLLAVRVERGAMRYGPVEIWRRLFRAVVPVPWLLAVLLVVNARFDRGQAEGWRTLVVGKFSASAMMPNHRLIVRSWREGHRFERVAVSAEDFDRFGVGDRIVVYVHSGLAGIPWVAGVGQLPAAGHLSWRSAH